MASKRVASTKKSKSDQFRFVRTLEKGTTLVACAVHMIGGLMAQVGTRAIVFRCLFTSIVIMMVFAVVLNVMTRYQEVHSGKA